MLAFDQLVIAAFIESINAPITKCHNAQIHHTRHALVRTIGASGLHENAFANSGVFERTPFVRKRPGECGLVCTRRRTASGRAFSHHTWAYPMKNRCSGVKPSMV